MKNLLAMRETWVISLGWEDPLEEGMATHSSILAQRIPVDSGAWQATVRGVPKSQKRLSTAQLTEFTAKGQRTEECRVDSPYVPILIDRVPKI